MTLCILEPVNYVNIGVNYPHQSTGEGLNCFDVENIQYYNYFTSQRPLRSCPMFPKQPYKIPQTFTNKGPKTLSPPLVRVTG